MFTYNRCQHLRNLTLNPIQKFSLTFENSKHTVNKTQRSSNCPEDKNIKHKIIDKRL